MTGPEFTRRSFSMANAKEIQRRAPDEPSRGEHPPDRRAHPVQPWLVSIVLHTMGMLFFSPLFDSDIDWEYEYAREESKRWRAWYDLTRGRLLATQARYLEYIAASHEIPAHLPPQSNQVALQPSGVIRNPESEWLIAEAYRCLNRCISANADTPWEDLARWERKTPCGPIIAPGTIPKPEPRIVTGSRRSPQNFSFPNL